MTLDQEGTLISWIAGPVVVLAGIVVTWALIQTARGKRVRTIFD